MPTVFRASAFWPFSLQFGVPMSNVTFAFVAATALFFLFKETRWMGVVGAFILVSLYPLIFGSVLLLAGVVYALVTIK